MSVVKKILWFSVLFVTVIKISAIHGESPKPVRINHIDKVDVVDKLNQVSFEPGELKNNLYYGFERIVLENHMNNVKFGHLEYRQEFFGSPTSFLEIVAHNSYQEIKSENNYDITFDAESTFLKDQGSKYESGESSNQKQDDELAELLKSPLLVLLSSFCLLLISINMRRKRTML